MIRRAPRLLRASQHCLRTPPAHRFISTAPPSQKSRSWKSLGARWGLALGVIYYYNTSNLFAEEPPCKLPLRVLKKILWVNPKSSLSTTPRAPRRRPLAVPNPRIRRYVATAALLYPRTPATPFRNAITGRCSCHDRRRQHARNGRRSWPRRRLQSRHRRNKLGLPLPRRYGPRPMW